MSQESLNMENKPEEKSPIGEGDPEEILPDAHAANEVMEILPEDIITQIIDEIEKLVVECSEKVEEYKELNDETRELMLKETESIGEEFKKRVIAKSSAVSLQPNSEASDINEEIKKIAEEEFKRILEEFERKLSKESKKILESISKDSICLNFKGESNTGKRTLAIIKPDAYKYADEIIQLMRKYGFVVVQERRVTLSPEQASLLYGQHMSKAFSKRLIDHMSSGPIVSLCLASAHCPNTVEAWRDIMGPTDVAEAIAIFPNTLRAKYGDPNDQVKNALHGSHSIEEAHREIHFFFPDIILDPLPTISGLEDVLDKESLKLLKKGLVILLREKPVHPLIWFAHWLLHNIPNSQNASYDWKPTIHFDTELGTGLKCFSICKRNDNEDY